jgi:hypothetical protein
VENSVVGIVTPKSPLMPLKAVAAIQTHGGADCSGSDDKASLCDNMQEDAEVSCIEAMRSNRCERKVIWLRWKRCNHALLQAEKQRPFRLDLIPRWNAATLTRIIARPGQLEQSR